MYGQDVFMKPSVVLIAPYSSYRLVPYLQAIEALDLLAIVVSQSRQMPISNRITGLHVDFAEAEQAFEKILAIAESCTVVAVIGSDDSTVALSARVAEALGLVHNDPDAVRYSRRKDLARDCLQKAGLRVPRFQCLSIRDALGNPDHSVGYPCVVKPVSLSGSRGVIRANTPEEFRLACARIQPILQAESLPDEEADRILIEQYIPGREYAFEGILQNGKMTRLILFDKPDPLEGPFFEETYYIMPSRLPEEQQQQVSDTVGLACAAYGLREGPVHAEVRLHEGQVWILEIAARTIGGQCARLLRFGTGRNLEELVVMYASGYHVELSEQDSAGGVLMIPIPRHGILRRVEGVMAALKIPYIEDLEISMREGYELVPLPEGDSYLGFIFARAPTADLAEQALREAHACLRIITTPILGMQQIAIPNADRASAV
jgi:biotin carboxylase